MSAAPSVSPSAAPAPAPGHSWFDDAQALVTGTLLAAFGIALFAQAGLLSGGTAGLSLLLHYATGAPFGALFFALNLPFYWLAWRRLGAGFALKTFAAVALLSVLVEALPRGIAFGSVDPLAAALAGGALIGVGFVILFRHRASLGGLNVLAAWLQEKRGWRAGWLQLGFDASIVLASLPWVDGRRIALSVLGAAVLNATLAVNHRPGRYVAG